MRVDISRTPFSKYGAFLSVSDLPTTQQLLVHNVRRKWGADRLLAITFSRQGQPVAYTVEATPAVITVTAEEGTARLYLAQDTHLVVESRGLDVTFALEPNQNGFGFEECDRRYKIISLAGQVFLALDLLHGAGQARFSREVIDGHQRSQTTEVQVSCVDGYALVNLEVSPVETRPSPLTRDPEADIAAVQAEWDAYLAKMPAVPEERRASAELAWYNMWSCFVRAGGNLAYDAMYMSKGYMASMWSWDHCFNALAVAKADVQSAIEQFLLPFELQQENGVLPDFWCVDDLLWGVVKPPVHGWCIHRIMAEHELAPALLQKIYRHLERWTNWWMTFRDTDDDGVPNYLQGVDSGWDNATLFDLGIGLESPDLPAFLILQMQALAEIAGKLGDIDGAACWQARAAKLLQDFIDHSWQDDSFVAKISRTHAYDPAPTSLLALMPIVLGEYLEREKFDCLVARLERDFLTPHGPATEAPSSPKYNYNGYWRGPIWAPSTYLLVDGLRRGGHAALARKIARGFCDMVEQAGGNYENYDALTGAGLCDQGYTWTASVNILLMHEYLLDDAPRP